MNVIGRKTEEMGKMEKVTIQVLCKSMKSLDLQRT